MNLERNLKRQRDINPIPYAKRSKLKDRAQEYNNQSMSEIIRLKQPVKRSYEKISPMEK